MKALIPSEIHAAQAELQRQRARGFVALCRHLAVHGSNASHAVDRLSPEIARATKAVVLAGQLGDAGDLHELAQLSLGWVQSLREGGPVFDRIMPAMRQAPMLSKFSISTAAIAATEVAESAPIPVTKLTLNGTDPLLPRTAAVIVVASAELMRLSEAAGLLDAELRAGVTAAVDSLFLADLIAETTPIVSSGNTAANTRTDIAALLDAVPLSASSAPFFVFEPSAAKRLALKYDGAWTWPDATATGGSLAGIPLLVSEELPSGTALLVDASQVAGNAGEVTPSVSTQADVEMHDSVTMDASPEAEDVKTSLWQHNMVGIRMNRTFAYKLLRSTAAASLSGVAY